MTAMENQRTVLITGCSDGGLGSALALALHKLGWRVIATARNLAKLSETSAAGIESVQLDVTSQSSIEACVEFVRKLVDGKLEALVHNAGSGYSMPLLDSDMQLVRQVFETNTFSIVPLVRAFLPMLRNSTKGGMVAIHTSIASRSFLPFQSNYNATKAASMALTEGLRLELAPFRVKVVEIVTGNVKSRFFYNIPDASLPKDSLYAAAREPIEKFMQGGDDGDGTDQQVWAKQVAADLSSSNPPYQIWRGKFAFEARLARLLPTGWLDGIVEPMVGIDVLKKKLTELEKSK